MFYEETLIDGVLHWRSHPRGKWIAKTPAELTSKVLELQRKLDAALANVTDDEWLL